MQSNQTGMLLDASRNKAVIVEKWLLDSQCTTNEKLLYIVLKSYSGFSKIFPGSDTIAYQASMHRTTVFRTLEKLKERKLVHVVSGKQYGMSNIYILATPDTTDDEISLLINEARTYREWVLQSATPSKGVLQSATPGVAESDTNIKYTTLFFNSPFIKTTTKENVVVTLKKILKGSPFDIIPQKGLDNLCESLKRINPEILILRADMLAETYRVSKVQVSKPYELLASKLTTDVIPPIDYVPYPEREKRKKENAASVAAAKKKQHDRHASKERLFALAEEKYRQLSPREIEDLKKQLPKNTLIFGEAAQKGLILELIIEKYGLSQVPAA